MPYMPFPPTWPAYVPKDKLANWFEAYVEALELNYWPQTELVHGVYDEIAQHWTVTLRSCDGSERKLHPRDIIMATGVSGIANRPNIPTLDDFRVASCIPVNTKIATTTRERRQLLSALAIAATISLRIFVPAVPT